MSKQKFTSFLFALSTCIFFLNKDYAQTIILGNSGKANYSIYVKDGNAQEKNAASILQNYFQQITGIQFEITSARKGSQIFVLTATDAKKVFPTFTVPNLQQDGVFIKTVNNNLLLIGGDSSGVQNVVYEFLEQDLGCRYFAEDAIYIPKHATITIPSNLNYSYVPVIKYRYINYAQAFKGNYAAWNKLTNQAGNPNTLKRPGWGLWVHSMFTLVPPDKYFKDHPEYYALRNGKRMKTQLDLTNPDVLKIATTSLAAIIKDNPDATFFSVSQMDNDGYCQCENCQRIARAENSQSGPIIDFVNKLAANFPDKIISTLAYNYSRTAPKNIIPANNVNILFCATGANRARSFRDDNEQGSVYSDLQNWKAKTGNIFFWDYLVDFSHLYMPFPNLFFLKPNITMLVENNIPYTFQQGWAFSEGEMNEMRCYLVAKLLWNPNINVTVTIKDFTDYFYGPAGKYINAYIQALNNYVQQNRNITLTNSDAPFDHTADFLSASLVKKYQQFFSEAIAAVENEDPLYKKRVQNAAQALRYTILETEAKQSSNPKNIAYYENILDTFRKVAQEQKANLVNEGTMKFADYYTEDSAYLKNSIVYNLALNATAKVIDPQGYIPKVPLSVLFDGSLGSKITDRKWVAFEKPYVELIVDMGKSVDFSNINMRFLHDPNFLTLLPEKISFSESDDNITFTNLGEAKNMFFGANALGVKKDIKNFQLSLSQPVHARYLKVVIKMIDPSNYAGTNKQPAMRCDEIILQ